MRNVLGVFLAALLAGYGYGCGTEPNAPDVEGVGAALLGSCEGLVDQLPMYAQWAADRTIEASSAYDADEENETVVRYFGQNYSHELLRTRLARLAEVGASTALSFECQDESVDDCKGENASTALWTRFNEHERTDGWTIRVCGDRFWSYGDESADAGGDATSIGTASRVGVMVHELAHLTGAVQGHTVLMREQLVIEGALDPLGSQEMPNNAEAFRFYVMNVD